MAEATRSLFDVVRQYRESYDGYGTKMAFEWEQLQDEQHVIFDDGENARRIDVPDTEELLIEPISTLPDEKRLMTLIMFSSYKVPTMGGFAPASGAGIYSCHY